MHDREKRENVVEGLEMSYRYSNVDDGNTLVPQQLVLDALALLKAQEPVRPRIGIIHNDDGSKSYFPHCPLDGTTLDEGDKYCRKCGRAVKWE